MKICRHRVYKLNITFVVEPHASDDWLEGVRSGLLPALRGGGFDNAVLSRVLTAHNEGHFTFSLLVELESMERYHLLTGNILPQYFEGLSPAFGSDVLWIMSLMKEIEKVLKNE